MIPVGDVIPSRTRPVVTLSIAAVTIVVAVAIRLGAGDRMTEVAASVGVTPAEFSLRRSLISPFLHLDFLSLTANMGMLMIAGRTLEDRLGHGRFVLLYAIGSLAGAVIVSLASATAFELVVGAGAAVGAVAGAYTALFPRSRVLMLVWLPFLQDAVEVPALVLVAVWGLCQLIAAADVFAPPGTGGVPALWNAIGGVVIGAGAVHVLTRRERLQVDWWS